MQTPSFMQLHTVLRLALASLVCVGCTASDRSGGVGETTAAAPATSPAPAAPYAGSDAQVAPGSAAPRDSAGHDSLGVDSTRSDTAARNAGRPADSARRSLPVSDVRIEVDLNARRLSLFRGTERIATHPVAIGSPKWPTRTGEWNVVQVIWNPEWIPPDESWADEGTRKAPGAPDNPLGHAQLVYDPPRSIHGTNDSTSIGKSVSHGSIRVTNTVAKQLARQLMELTGVNRDEAWYRATQTNRTVKQIVDLPQLVPIRVF